MGHILRVRVLNRFSVSADGVEVKLRANAAQLLAYLCLHYEEKNIPRGEIVKTLGLKSGATLGAALFQLKGALEKLGVQFSPDRSDELWIDVNSIDLDYACYQACRRHMDVDGSERAAVEKFLSAAEWFSGLPLANWQYPWACAEQAEIEEEFWDDYHKRSLKVIAKSLRATHILSPFVSAVQRSLKGESIPGFKSPFDEFCALLEEFGTQRRFGLTARAEDMLGNLFSMNSSSIVEVETLGALFKDFRAAAVFRRDELEKAGLVPTVDHLLQDCWDLRPIVDSVADSRVTAIVAPTGFGKTTLAVLIADLLKGDFHRGVWRVPLEHLGRESDDTQGENVVAEINKAFHTSTAGNTTADLVQSLQNRSLLLILDACEAAPLGCSEVVSRLDQAKDVKILLTTQGRLRVEDQNIIELKALVTPEPNRDYTLAQLKEFPSGALFCMLWHRNRGRLLTDADGRMIAQILYFSKGIPLEITLAASMVKSPFEEIIECVRDKAYGGDEKAFLRRRIIIKIKHLTPSAEDLFFRLGVFAAGGWDKDAAERICSDQSLSVAQVRAGLTELCARSLVERSTATGRYSLLDMMRTVAKDRLTTDGLWDHFSKRHFDYYKDIALLIAEHSKEADMPQYMDKIQWDGSNIAQALGWADSCCPSEGASVCNALLFYWAAKGYVWEGQQWFKRFSDEHAGAISDEASALLLHGRGVLSYLQSDYASAADFCERCLNSNALPNQHPANVLNLIVAGMGKFHAKQDQQLIALDDFRKSVAVAKENKYQWELALGAGNLALHLAILAEKPPKGTSPEQVAQWRDEAIQYGQMGEATGRDTGNQWVLGFALMNRGSALRLLDFEAHYTLIGELYRRALHIRVQLNDRYGQNQSLYKLAAIACQKGYYKRAALILGSLGGLLGPIPIPLHNQPDFMWTKERTETALGGEFEAVSARGAQLSLSQLTEFAVSERTELT